MLAWLKGRLQGVAMWMARSLNRFLDWLFESRNPAVVFVRDQGHVAACAGSWRDGLRKIRSHAANLTWSPRRNPRALHSRLMSLPCDYRRGTQMAADAFRETRRS